MRHKILNLLQAPVSLADAVRGGYADQKLADMSTRAVDEICELLRPADHGRVAEVLSSHRPSVKKLWTNQDLLSERARLREKIDGPENDGRLTIGSSATLDMWMDEVEEIDKELQRRSKAWP